VAGRTLYPTFTVVDENVNRRHSNSVELSEQQIIDQLAGRLVEVYQQVEPAHVSRIVHQEYARFDGHPIRDYIPLFVERNAKVELAKLGG
jgi:hypothetical protein